MKTGPRVAFIQKRAHKAGAQTGLARLLGHPDIRRLDPVLIVSEVGWLTEEVRKIGVKVVLESFPSSRSVPARLLLNRLFARRVKKKLEAVGYKPDIIQANDHLEGLLALELSAATGAASSILLRSPWMIENDYWKYKCDRFDVVAAIGEALCASARAWDRRKEIRLVHDGLCESEFGPAKVRCEEFPSRVLVLGSPLKSKGWADFSEALYLLEQKTKLPFTVADFTGVKPDSALNDLKADRLRTVTFNFLGRVAEFRELVLQYDLAVHPSRGETFGLAAMETVAAGVPILSSRSGVIEQVLDRDHMLFEPHNPESLAEKLEYLMTHWSRLDFGVSEAQEAIREKFGIDRCVHTLLQGYRELFRE